jgi:hypothetical protein
VIDIDRHIANATSSDLDGFFRRAPQVIELPAATRVSFDRNKRFVKPPIIQTRSATGILKAATEAPGNVIGRTALSDRPVLIDPNDVEHPPCLNLFDFGLERLTRYSAVEREKLVNGAIALYEYLFGALLGAELTQRQGVIFRYLARLLMVVPGATIQTLLAFMEEPETARPYLSSLDPMSRQFFETQPRVAGVLLLQTTLKQKGAAVIHSRRCPQS